MTGRFLETTDQTESEAAAVLIYRERHFVLLTVFTWAAMGNPDVKVQTVLTPSGIGHDEVHLNASLLVLSGLQDTW